MRKEAIAVLLGVLFVIAGGGIRAHAADPDMLGGEPKEFHVVILADGPVSFTLPSTIIVDEKQRRVPLELVVSNHTKKEHGFSIDKFKVKEIVKPGETKTIKISVTDLDAIGTDQSAFRYYCQLHKGHVGGQLYVKR